jgi:spore coat polysaccharide biosynthesis predicted glycosyltransferase SpsG/RimJ/RimL family protein N-acetyltransferase
MERLTVFRCDGGQRVGAGHVARCLQLAAAFRLAGEPILFAGRYDGIARRLVTAAGVPTASPSAAPAGIPARATAAVVDSYEIGDEELSTVQRVLPVAVICDGQRAPAVTAAITYRADAESLELPAGTIGILGPDYAPVDPTLTRARRRRGFDRVLVTMGASTAARGPLLEALRVLGDIDGREIFVAGAVELPRDLAGRAQLRAGVEPGLRDRIEWADAAVAAAGTTAYDFACAGLPAVLQAIAANQQPFARSLEAAGTALLAMGNGGPGISGAVAALADPARRDRLAAGGPALIDGYGAFRARDAILDAFAGRPLRRPLRYRPATAADAEPILRWRNDPATRAASRTTEPIDDDTHERWLERRLADPAEPLLVIERAGEPVGSVRFDREDSDAEISIALDPAHRGAGLGTRAIRETSELSFAADPWLGAVIATVRTGNTASQRAFTNAGFVIEQRDATWARMRLPRPD